MNRLLRRLLFINFAACLLTFLPLSAGLVEVPKDAVGWWRAERNNLDYFGNGTTNVPGGATFLPGYVGQAFSFDGTAAGVIVGNPKAFQLQNLTIESWIRRSDPVLVSGNSPAGTFFAGGADSYSLVIEPGGLLSFSQIGVSKVSSTIGITDTNWHHVAVTKDGGVVAFYVDGAGAGTNSYNPVFTFNAPFAIGSFGAPYQGSSYSFLGLIDELSLYGRALSADEIAAIYQAGASGKNAENVQVTASAPAVVGTGADFNARFFVKNGGLHPATNVLLNVSLPTGYTLVTNTASLGSNAVSATSVQDTVGILQPAETLTVTLTGHGETPGTLVFHAQISRDGAGPTAADDATDLSVTLVDATAPNGLVGWWRAEGDNTDVLGNGRLDVPGGAGFAPGEVGQAFSFAGNAPGVIVGNPPAFQLQDFTIETWIKRASPGRASQFDEAGVIFAGGNHSYGIALEDTGVIVLSEVGVTKVSSTGTIVDTAWHHVAVTKSGTAVNFYIDGVAAGSATYEVTFTFNTPFAVGSLGAPFGANLTFWGLIDETSLYNRALSDTEISRIFAAGASGKPYENISLSAQAVQTVLPDALFTVTFAVVNHGLEPATNVVLNTTLPAGFTLISSTTTQGANAVTDMAVGSSFGALLPGDTATVTLTGRATSVRILGFDGQVSRDGTDATLMDNRVSVSVEAIGPCFSVTDGLLVWLHADGTEADALSHTVDSLGTGYARGRVGQAFDFNGVSGEVDIENSADLAPTNFTIETWVYPTAVDGNIDIIASKESSDAYGDAQLELGIKGPIGSAASAIPQGNLTFFLGDVIGLPDDLGGWTDAHAALPLNQWSHVALTLGANTATVYINGSATRRLTGLTGAPLLRNAPLRLGARDPYYIGFVQPLDRFNGRIDEFSYYSRALPEAEIAGIYQAGGAGKCVTAIPPRLVVAPFSQSVPSGRLVTFQAVAVGTAPFTYQWKFNGVDIAGATNSTLNIPAPRRSAAGSYGVTVCNVAGCAPFAEASLSITPGTPIVNVGGTTVHSLDSFEVPVRLIGNGVENSLGFTLRFDTNRLIYLDADLGADATDGAFLVNSSQASKGILGISLTLPAGEAFAQETNDVLHLTFGTTLATANASTTFSLSDILIPRTLTSTNGQSIQFTFVSGTVAIIAAEFEGDVDPRPAGNRRLDISDWTQVGRYVAGLDDLPAGAPFQRADCAPLATAGDGQLTVSDWVQAGRFAAGLDVPSKLGGPREPRAGLPEPPAPPSRVVSLGSPALVVGQTQEIPVTLIASGEENALGFSLSYDPAVLKFVGAVKGAGGQKASLNVNTRPTADGKAAVALTLNPGSKFPAGALEVARLQFMAIGGGSGTATVAFTDLPVVREVADVLAVPLGAIWQGASLSLLVPTVNARAVTTADGPAIELSWPTAFTGAVLETAATLDGADWTPVSATPTVNDGQNTVVLPRSAAAAYFHLRLP
ncbi:MAG TPA: LamG-like jellyroll fold domain-containing protein [Candidatus Limnocylindria bacterium]|nr:LamG-like jellyroll fold domain-containing protein [Candidatus Limnocylindria bacterium]